MIHLNLLQVLLARGIEKPYTWLCKQGFTRNIALGLLKQPGSIGLKHLNTLCRVLHCTPNDLFRYTPSADNALPANHPLNTLIRKEVPASLPQQLRTLPQEHLDKVLELIEQLQGEEKS